MKNFSSWLIAMFAFMFWGFRLVGTVLSSIGIEFMFTPSNMTMEVVLLFLLVIFVTPLVYIRLFIYIHGCRTFFYDIFFSFMSYFLSLKYDLFALLTYLLISLYPSQPCSSILGK